MLSLKNNDDQRLQENETKIYQIFNFTNKLNKDVHCVTLNNSRDQEEIKSVKEIINKDQAPEQTEESDNVEEQVPNIIKTLFKSMNYETYIEKLKDPMWIYKSINLCDGCYMFIKDISEFMIFNKALHSHKSKIQIDSLNDKNLQNQLNMIDSVMQSLENSSIDKEDHLNKNIVSLKRGKTECLRTIQSSQSDRNMKRQYSASQFQGSSTLRDKLIHIQNDDLQETKNEDKLSVDVPRNINKDNQNNTSKKKFSCMNKNSTARILLSRAKISKMQSRFPHSLNPVAPDIPETSK